MSKPAHKLLTTVRGAKSIIEHDCIACGESYDKKKTSGADELCRYCGSKDIHTRPGVHHKPHKAEEKYYNGADIFDQYGHPGY